MYQLLIDELSVSADFTDLTRLGLFFDIGKEFPMDSNTIVVSFSGAYLAGAYTGNGGLQDDSLGYTLEQFNADNGTSFTHASFANDQFFLGVELYYHQPMVSFFLSAQSGVYERSDVSRWFAEQNDSSESLKGRSYGTLALGVGRLF